jgi:hypothetical protein
VTGHPRGVRIDETQEGGFSIFDSVASHPLDDTYTPGNMPGMGTYFCLSCGGQVSLRETDSLPACPACGDASRFRRDSIFAAMQDHGSTTREFAIPTEARPPEWLEGARRALRGAGRYLVMREEDGSIVIFTIERGWTRIGRSATADLRLDHPSVSRRHALIVAEPGRELRVLDDRSLNGVYVNGVSTEWGTLRDGDELTVGGYKLYALKA